MFVDPNPFENIFVLIGNKHNFEFNVEQFEVTKIENDAERIMN